jgi:hypothetical protein
VFWVGELQGTSVDLLIGHVLWKSKMMSTVDSVSLNADRKIIGSMCYRISMPNADWLPWLHRMLTDPSSTSYSCRPSLPTAELAHYSTPLPGHYESTHLRRSEYSACLTMLLVVATCLGC